MARAHDPIAIQVMTKDEELMRRLLALAASYEREGGLSCRLERGDRLEARTAPAPALVIVDLDSMADHVLESIQIFRQQGGRSVIAVACEQLSSERLLRAMRLGASDYLSLTPTLEEFSALLGRFIGVTGQVGLGRRGQMVAVLSNKGGVGTTMVAINTAAALAHQLPGAVAVVDLVLQRGDLSVFLDVPTTYTVVNLVTELERADPSYLKSVLPRHRSGMHVVSAPYAPEEAELVTPVQVGRLLQRLATTFEAVVVDAGNEVNDRNLPALDAADRILLVTLPNLPSIRNTKRTLELFERLKYDPSKVVVVVNRFNAKEKLTQREMEEALGRPVQAQIPNDYATVMQAINLGTVARLVQPKGTLATAFDQLVSTQVLMRTNGAPAASRPWWLSRRVGAVPAGTGKGQHGIA